MLQTILLFAVSVLTAAGAQLCLKKGVLKLGELSFSLSGIFSLIPDVLQNVWLLLGMFLFGISFIFFFMGFIFSFAAGVPKWLKIISIATPFGFMIIDILSWWLTKWSPGFAWFVIIGGFGYSVASSIMWTISLYQMLILSRNGKIYGNAWESDLK